MSRILRTSTGFIIPTGRSFTCTDDETQYEDMFSPTAIAMGEKLQLNNTDYVESNQLLRDILTVMGETNNELPIMLKNIENTVPGDHSIYLKRVRDYVYGNEYGLVGKKLGYMSHDLYFRTFTNQEPLARTNTKVLTGYKTDTMFINRLIEAGPITNAGVILSTIFGKRQSVR